MELRPYYDRPTGQIKSYLSLIETKIASNFPHWGKGSQGVWPKGDYGKGILRADQFSILGTYGQWLIPSSGSTGNPNSVSVDSFGWASFEYLTYELNRDGVASVDKGRRIEP
jgi:hypothetical protein